MKAMDYTPPVYDATVADKPAITWKNGDRTSFIFAHELAPHVAQKRLSDAECAAEYWHAAYCEAFTVINADLDTGMQFEHEADTWHRFATAPHAFEGGY